MQLSDHDGVSQLRKEGHRKKYRVNGFPSVSVIAQRFWIVPRIPGHGAPHQQS